jgi:DNA-binding MarR family transcriptional regulator
MPADSPSLLPPPRRRSPTVTPPPEVVEAINHARRLERGLRLAARQVESRAGASAAQLFVLRQLADGAALSLRDLTSRTLTDRTSVSEVVDRLLSRRLVIRGVSPTDRRRAEIRITGSGRRVLATAPTTPAQLLIEAVTGLPRATRRALATALGQLNEALGFAADRPRMLFEEDRARRSRRPPRGRNGAGSAPHYK